MTASVRQKFGAAVIANRKKYANQPRTLEAKVRLRRNLVEALGADRTHVLDLFAGAGEIWEGAYQDVGSYTGCDLEWFRDSRRLFVVDNMLLVRAIPLESFNLFDVDAWGSPWAVLYLIAKRRKVEPGERLAFAITEGTSLKMRLGQLPAAMAWFAGVNPTAHKGLRQQDLIIERACFGLARELGCEIVDRWQAKPTNGSKMVYLSLLMKAPAAPREEKAPEPASATSPPQRKRTRSRSGQKKGAPESAPSSGS